MVTNKDFVDGLRSLANWYKKHPDIQTPSGSITVATFVEGENKAVASKVAKALGTFEMVEVTREEEIVEWDCTPLLEKSISDQ